MLAYVLDESYRFLLLLSKDIEQISGKTKEPRFLSGLNPPPSASLELMKRGEKERRKGDAGNLRGFGVIGKVPPGLEGA